ncbi:MAG: hypothetical protein KY461_00585 [Actinobacteria bacterium]|nr:hypothetical protein [Actinomycetota bacterium]
MSADEPRNEPVGGPRAPSSGTPVPVDLSSDRRSRGAWFVFLAGPLIWLTHFAIVYLSSEAGCNADGAILERFDPPVPVVVTWVATAVAVPLCAAAALRAWRWWHADRDEPVAVADGDLRGTHLPFMGFLLAVGSLIAVLFTAAPALVLSCTG